MNNLNYDTTEKQLESAFKEYGVVERVVIGYKSNGRSLGNAQVQFKTKQQAEAAIDGMHESELDGRPIRVKVYKSYDNYKKDKDYTPGTKGEDQD